MAKITPAAPESAAEWVAIDRLTPWDRNPRVITPEAVAGVAESIRRFGFASPVIARKADGVVIAGHTRLQAALSLGLDQVPVRWMDLDPADAALLALADNKVAEKTAWSDDLGALLADLEADNDLADLGWSEEELNALLADPDDGIDFLDQVNLDGDGDPRDEISGKVEKGSMVDFSVPLEPDERKEVQRILATIKQTILGVETTRDALLYALRDYSA